MGDGGEQLRAWAFGTDPINREYLERHVRSRTAPWGLWSLAAQCQPRCDMPWTPKRQAMVSRMSKASRGANAILWNPA